MGCFVEAVVRGPGVEKGQGLAGLCAASSAAAVWLAFAMGARQGEVEELAHLARLGWAVIKEWCW